MYKLEAGITNQYEAKGTETGKKTEELPMTPSQAERSEQSYQASTHEIHEYSYTHTDF
jgi:hypothetical protein